MVSERERNQYREQQEEWVARNGLKNGSFVKVVREANSYENGWSSSWSPRMSEFKGRVGIVRNLIPSATGGICVYFEREREDWFFPYFVLDVEGIRFWPLSYGFEARCGEAVLVRDSINEEWIYALFSHSRRIGTRRIFVCTGGEYSFCIPFLGHQQLVGSSMSCERENVSETAGNPMKAEYIFGAVVMAQRPSGLWERGILIGQRIIDGTNHFTVAVQDADTNNGYRLLVVRRIEFVD